MGMVSDSRETNWDLVGNLSFKFCTICISYKSPLYWQYWWQGIIVDDP